MRPHFLAQYRAFFVERRESPAPVAGPPFALEQPLILQPIEETRDVIGLDPALSEALLSKTPPVVFEALDKKYYDFGHIPSARMLPPAEIDRVVPSVVADKNQPIVLYCASATCQNSHQAAAHLEKQGYRNVAVYAGGKQDGVEAGLRLEK